MDAVRKMFSHDSLLPIVFKIRHTQDFPRFGMILERSVLRHKRIHNGRSGANQPPK